MSYLIAILAAALSKKFFNSRLCQGEYGFSKTYFLYGGVGAFAIYFAIIFVFGYSALSKQGDELIDGLEDAAGIGLFCLAVYLSGISLAVYKIKKRSEFSPLMNLYVAFILICFAVALLNALSMVSSLFVLYAIALFFFYKFAWGGAFIESRV